MGLRKYYDGTHQTAPNYSIKYDLKFVKFNYFKKILSTMAHLMFQTIRYTACDSRIQMSVVFLYIRYIADLVLGCTKLVLFTGKFFPTGAVLKFLNNFFFPLFI